MEATAFVGIDLDSIGGDIVDAIIEAIKLDNKDVAVEDFGTFKKVKAPVRLTIHRETVEECLGRDFSIHELQIYMASYFGFIEENDDDTFTICWNNLAHEGGV